MNCKNAELYMDALLDDELPVQDSIEIVEHIDNCAGCKTKWELSEEIRAKFKHFIKSIKAEDGLRKKIASSLNEDKQSVYYFKPLMLAASIAFLIGLGIFSKPLMHSPTLPELHTKANIKFVSDNIENISGHLGIKLKKENLIAFENANFKPGTTTKIQRLFNNDIDLIAFKNDKGQKISLCFLPENYKIPECHEVNQNGVTFHCGNGEKCQFAYWKQDGKTIGLVSDSFTSEELINFAIPLTEQV